MLHNIDLREILECAHLKFTVSGRSKQTRIDKYTAVTLVRGSLRVVSTMIMEQHNVKLL